MAFPVGFAFQKNSIYTEAFAYVLGWMAGSGLAEKWNSDVSQNYTRIGKEWIKSQRAGCKNEAPKSIDSHAKRTGFLKLQNVSVIFVVMVTIEFFALMAAISI